MFTVTAIDCDGTNLAPTADGEGYQVSLPSQAEVDAYLVDTKSGFAPAPEDGGPRPRNRVVKFLVKGPGGTKEIERGSAEHAAAQARVDRAAADAKAAKKAKREAEEAEAKAAKEARKAAKEDPEVTKLQGELGTLNGRLTRTKDADKRAATEAKIAEVQQKLAALGAS
jgi:hypothetical protein